MIGPVSPNKKFWRYCALWAVLLGLILLALALLERQSLVREFTSKSATLHRLASQRADQHDAHMTSLSAIFVAGGAARQDLFLDVVTTINRFYPRIVSVNIVPLRPSDGGIEALSGLDSGTAARVREMAAQSSGGLQLAQHPSMPTRYLLVKRSPNTDGAKHALALAIDARGLVASSDPFWARSSVSLRLLTPDGIPLIGERSFDGIAFSKPLGSASQPLIFESALALGPGDILSPGRTLVATVLFSGVFLLILLGLRQRARTREAESRALLSAQEARLAHASRVNALGEMASGMAHELAQPLTAILSQAQAGRHLVQRGETDRLRAVLDDTISQAQRASDILERLRRWTKPNRAEIKACDLNDAVRGVQQLMAPEVKTVGASLELDLSARRIMIDADPVELEQVIFNLVRNALEASEAPDIRVKTAKMNGRAILEVRDTGPGVPDALRSRIFEPFVTGRPNGTGLGLALCQRLVEEMDGDLTLRDDTAETTFRLSVPLSASGGER